MDRPSAEPMPQMKVAMGRSSLGVVLVAQSPIGISAVLLGGNRDALRRDVQRRFPGVTFSDGDRATRAALNQVLRAIETPTSARSAAATPLDLRGTEFQRKVWRALQRIPLQATASYKQLAIRIGVPSSARAVAQACAANPIAILIPCHRVVRSDGALSGYRWGIARKRALLKREGADPQRGGSGRV